MIKLLKIIILLPIFAILITFAVSNRDYISLQLWPLPYKIEAPIYLLLIAIFVFSTIICSVISLFSKADVKSELKEAHKLLQKAKDENILLKERIENLKQKNVL